MRPPLNFRVIYDRYHFVTPQDMCKQALLVAEVTVSGAGPSRWTTPDGARPATSDYNVISKAGWLIVTPVQFSRFNPLLDHRSTPTQEFLMYGGQVGQDSYDAVGTAHVTDGSRYVVVFTPDGYPTTNPHAEDRLVVFDAFPIDAQDVVTLQQAGDPSEPGVGPVQQQVTISLAQLAQDLAHCG